MLRLQTNEIYPNVVSGIDDEKMRQTISEIYDIAEKLNEQFLKFENLMANVEDYLSCNASSSVYNKFNDFKTNFEVVVANVQNYGDDLNKVRINFNNMISDAADMLNKS